MTTPLDKARKQQTLIAEFLAGFLGDFHKALIDNGISPDMADSLVKAHYDQHLKIQGGIAEQVGQAQLNILQAALKGQTG